MSGAPTTVGMRAGAGLLAALAAACSGGAGGGVTGSAEVQLLDVQVQVFSPSCAITDCHVGPDAPFGLDLSAGLAAGNLIGVESAEVAGLLRVEPYNAADSYLYMKLTGDPAIEGDPMPLTGGPLSAGDLALVEAWIEQGAM